MGVGENQQVVFIVDEGPHKHRGRIMSPSFFLSFPVISVVDSASLLQANTHFTTKALIGRFLSSATAGLKNLAMCPAPRIKVAGSFQCQCEETLVEIRSFSLDMAAQYIVKGTDLFKST